MEGKARGLLQTILRDHWQRVEPLLARRLPPPVAAARAAVEKALRCRTLANGFVLCKCRTAPGGHTIMSSETRKPVILLLLALTGGGLVLLWPVVERALPIQLGPPQAIPMISTGAAQQKVPFPLWVPRQMPSGGQLLGVRVSEPKVRNAAQALESYRTHRRGYVMTGTGIAVDLQGGRKVVFGLPGSPAERAGIGPEPHLLLSMDGDPVAKPGSVTPAELRRLRPIRVTYRTLEGEPRSVVLKYETFNLMPSPPELHRGLEAALIFMVHGKSAALIESRARGYFSREPSGARPLEVAGRQVVLSGPPVAPTVRWTSGRTSFRLDNPQGALNRSEVVELLRSLHPM
jgi:hypothetical protein